MTTVKRSYDYELLQKFCEENKIELLKDYSNQKLKKIFVIEGKRIREGCNDCFSKTFQMLLHHCAIIMRNQNNLPPSPRETSHEVGVLNEKRSNANYL
jgi:hypothetical protein